MTTALARAADLARPTAGVTIAGRVAGFGVAVAVALDIPQLRLAGRCRQRPTRGELERDSSVISSSADSIVTDCDGRGTLAPRRPGRDHVGNRGPWGTRASNGGPTGWKRRIGGIVRTGQTKRTWRIGSGDNLREQRSARPIFA